MAKEKEQKGPILKRKLASKKILKRQTQITLDLRQRQIGPVKQHGFKEMEISNTDFLFN